MGKTHTNLSKKYLDGMTHPWQEEKYGHHKPMGKGRGGKKLRTGHGGINCPCCTRMTPEALKVATRRLERRKGNQDASNWRNNQDNSDNQE